MKLIARCGTACAIRGRLAWCTSNRPQLVGAHSKLMRTPGLRLASSRPPQRRTLICLVTFKTATARSAIGVRRKTTCPRSVLGATRVSEALTDKRATFALPNSARKEQPCLRSGCSSLSSLVVYLAGPPSGSLCGVNNLSQASQLVDQTRDLFGLPKAFDHGGVVWCNQGVELCELGRFGSIPGTVGFR